MKRYKVIDTYVINGIAYDGVQHQSDNSPNYKQVIESSCFYCAFNTNRDNHRCSEYYPNPCFKYDDVDYFIEHHD